MDFGTTILGAIGSVLGLVMPVTVVGIILWYKAPKNQLMHATALKLAEQGQPIPPAFFAKQSASLSNLRYGVVLVLLGVGICLALYLCQLRFWAFGIIPMFMGLGYLIVWKLDDGELSDDVAQETFILAWKNIKSFRYEAKFSTWLYRIAFNAWQSEARKKHDVLSDDGLLPEQAAVESVAETSGVRRDLDRCGICHAVCREHRRCAQ